MKANIPLHPVATALEEALSVAAGIATRKERTLVQFTANEQKLARELYDTIVGNEEFCPSNPASTMGPTPENDWSPRRKGLQRLLKFTAEASPCSLSKVGPLASVIATHMCDILAAKSCDLWVLEGTKWELATTKGHSTPLHAHFRE